MKFNVFDSFQMILLLFMLVGLLLGLWRGFGKSVIRIITVICMGVLTFFVSGPISKSLLSTDVSKFGWSISGVKIRTIESAIVEILRKVDVIDELMGASPSFKAVIEGLPYVVLNVIIFIVAFLLFKVISLLISFIFYKVCLKKVPKGEHKKYRLIGGLIGMVQGAFVFAIIMVPIFGVMKIGNIATQNYNQPTKEATATTTGISNSTSSTATNMGWGVETVAESSSSNKLDDTVEKTTDYVKEFNNLTFVKVWKALGIKQLSEKAFGYQSSFKVKNEEISIYKETEVVSKIASKYNTIKNINTNLTEEQVSDLRFIVNTTFDSGIFSKVVSEVVPYAATEMMDPTDGKAFGVAKPKTTAKTVDLVDSVLNQLKVSNSKTLKIDLIQIIEVANIASKNGLLKSISSSKDPKSIMSKLEDQTVFESIIVEMVKSPTLKVVLPQTVQTGLNFMYPSLGIPENSQDNINKYNEEIITVITGATDQADLSSKLAQTIGRYSFGLDSVDQSIKDDWFDAMALEFYGTTVTSEQLQTYFETHPVDPDGVVDSGDELDLGDINSARKTADQLKVNGTLTDEEWIEGTVTHDAEKTILATVFSNMFKALDSVENSTAGNELEEMDMIALAKAFDGLRESRLLNDPTKPTKDKVSFNIVKAILQSDLMKNINITESFIATFETNWETMNFEETLNTLESAVTIMSAFSNGDSLNAQTTKNLIEGLTGDSKEVVLELVDKTLLDSTGKDDSLTQATSDVINAISEQTPAEDTDYDKESKALNSALEILNNTNKDADIVAEGQSEGLIADLLAADIVTKAILDSNSDETDGKTGDNFGTKDAVNNSDTAKNEIVTGLNTNRATIDAMPDGPEKSSQYTKLDAIASSLFGMTWDGYNLTYKIL